MLWWLLRNDLTIYKYPNKEEVFNSKIESLFFGYFFPWDGHRNAIESKKKGFKFYNGIVEGTGVSYENLDNYLPKLSHKNLTY